MIRAGNLDEVHRESGNWLFVDIGFSHTTATCGFLDHDGEPRRLKFSSLLCEVARITAQTGSPLNLLVEAPLSVSFTAKGNPAGRSMERQLGKTRYWYVGAGCAVLTASTYLLRRIVDIPPAREVRLFEGFVSFKSKNNPSSDCQDVASLRSVAWDANRSKDAVISKEQLAVRKDDVLLSAFKVAGMDFGIPPVVRVDG